MYGGGLLMWVFVCDRDDREGPCDEGPRSDLTVPQITVRRNGKTPQEACKAAAEAFFASSDNLRYSQVEVTIEKS